MAFAFLMAIFDPILIAAALLGVCFAPSAMRFRMIVVSVALALSLPEMIADGFGPSGLAGLAATLAAGLVLAESTRLVIAPAFAAGITRVVVTDVGRRTVQGDVTPGRVAGFLLLDSRFPRSVSLCVREIRQLLLALRRVEARCEDEADEELLQLDGELGSLPIGEILARGLHEYIERIQGRLINVSTDLSARYFQRN